MSTPTPIIWLCAPRRKTTCLYTFLLVLWDIVSFRQFRAARPIEEDSTAHSSEYTHPGEALHLLPATHRNHHVHCRGDPWVARWVARRVPRWVPGRPASCPPWQPICAPHITRI